MKLFNKSGFTLLEMSMVIMIAGIMSTFMLDIFSVTSKVSKSKLNNQKIEDIEKAFYAFIIKNNRLPIPADITHKIDTNTNTFGREQSDTSIKKTGHNNNLYIGMLPAIDLDLSPEYAYDAYGNKLVYIVNSNCTNENGILKCDTSEDNLIKVNTNNTITNNVVFAIISNGLNRKYSYNINSSTQNIPKNGNLMEKCNSHDYFGNNGTCSNTIYNKIHNNKDFDDKIIFGSQNFIMAKLNMYDVGCISNIDATKILDNCNIEYDDLTFPTINPYIKYRQIIESEEYTIGLKKYKCVIECGPFGKISYYNYITKTIIEEIVQDADK